MEWRDSAEMTLLHIDNFVIAFQRNYIDPLNAKLMGLYALIGVAIIIGICILVNQRKIKKMLKDLADKP